MSSAEGSSDFEIFQEFRSYQNSQTIIVNKYEIFWNASSQGLFLGILVRSHSGWFGFGLAEPTSGGMGGADIVVLERTKDQGIEISDRHGLGKFEPVIDNCQNWKLVKYVFTQAGDVFVQLYRELDTQDPQDRVITPGDMRVIGALGDSLKLSFHGPSCMCTSVVFMSKRESVPKIEGNTLEIKLRMNFTLPPDQKDLYACQAFELPRDKPYHIVKFSPRVAAGNERCVHHILLHVCEYDLSVANLVRQYSKPESTQCVSPLGNIFGGCYSLAYAWEYTSSADAKDLYVPEEAGFLVGPRSDAIHYIIMEFHYTNTRLMPKIYDNSGVDLLLTDKLRPYDAAVMSMGDVLTTNNPIPGGKSLVTVQTECPSECTSKWSHEITVFGSFLHMHSYGSSIYTVHSRNGKRLGYTNRIEFWDEKLQKLHLTKFVIKPGDQLNTICNYNTRRSAVPVKFGSAATDEMCVEIISYYPKLRTKSGKDYAFCGLIGYQLKVVGGVNEIIRPTPSTLCGTLDENHALDTRKSTLKNPLNPINVSNENPPKFGDAAEMCKTIPDWSLMLTDASSHISISILSVLSSFILSVLLLL